MILAIKGTNATKKIEQFVPEVKEVKDKTINQREWMQLSRCDFVDATEWMQTHG